MESGLSLDFVACATTPDGELYQLGASRKRGYSVFRVTRDGAMHACRGGDYPPCTTDRVGALQGFREWAEANGYEYSRNELSGGPKRYRVTIEVFRAGSADIYLDAASPDDAKGKASRRFRRHMRMKPYRMSAKEVEPK